MQALGSPNGIPDLVGELRVSLREILLAHWYPAVVDEQCGGYLSNLAHDWAPGRDQDKMIVTQARHVWTTSKALDFFSEQREEYLAMATHGVAFLRDKMWDRERGGFVSLVSRDGTWKRGGDAYTQGKTSYGNAFAIYALAAHYAASRDLASLILAERAFRWLDDHMHDPKHGGYFRFVGPDDAVLVDGWRGHPPKDQNSSIHLLEAFTELYSVRPDPTVRDRLEELLLLVRDRLATEKGYLRQWFEADWTPAALRDSREVAARAKPRAGRCLLRP